MSEKRVRLINLLDKSEGYNRGECSEALWQKIIEAQERRETMMFELRSYMDEIPVIKCCTSPYDLWAIDYKSVIPDYDIGY